MFRVSQFATAIAGIAFVASLYAADLKSGPQVGKSVTPFNPTHVTGPDAGKSSCLVWKNGGNPVVAIFAREIDDNLASLVKQIDKATTDNAAKKMGSFVIFLTDDKDTMEKKIKEFAEKNGIKKTVLAIDNPAGPDGYNIDKNASVTTLLYTGRKVTANHAFEKGKMDSKAIEKIIEDLPKILK